MKKVWFASAIVALMLGIVAVAYAATTVSDTVVVQAKASPAIEMSLSTNLITLLDLAPGASDSDPVDIGVRSNKSYFLKRAVTDGTPAAFTVAGDDAVATAAGVAYGRTAGSTVTTHTDTLTGTMNWAADGDSTYSSSVLYTAVHQ